MVAIKTSKGWPVLLAGGLGFVVSCGAPAPAPARASSAARSAPDEPAEPAPAEPGEGRPGGGEASRVLAVVAGEVVDADDAFPLMFLSDPEAARSALRQAVLDRLIAVEAERVQATVSAEDVEAQVEEVLEDFVDRVRSTLSTDVESYVLGQFGLDFASYRSWIHRSVENSLLLERLILYELRQHARIQVRLIRVDTRELAEEILGKLQRGADFGRLARAHSNDAAADQGGLYPAMPVGLGYPLLEEIAELESGELDRVRSVDEGGEERFRVLQLLTRLAAQPSPYADARDEIEDELKGRVVGSLELDAWMRIVEARHRVRFNGIGTLGEASVHEVKDRGSE